MKKYIFIFASLVLYAVQALAFGPGNVSGTWEEAVVRDAAGVGVRAGSEAGMNDRLKKENCHFVNDATDKDIRCKSGGLDKIIDYLDDWKAGLENSVASSVNVTIKAHAKDYNVADKRARYVEDRIRGHFGYWHYYVDGSKTGDNNLNISVKVR